jgi:hypothetical protein
MGKKVGRPRKADLEKIKKPGKPGRPPGQAAAIKEFTARIINSPKSRKVMDAIVSAALDDDHKNQAAAWKILMDRMVPLSAFEKGGTGGKPTININISGVTDVSAESVQQGETYDDAEDVSWEPSDQGSDPDVRSGDNAGDDPDN